MPGNLAGPVFTVLRTDMSRSLLPKITSFPRTRESIGVTMGPRFRGDDKASFHSLARATDRWNPPGQT